MVSKDMCAASNSDYGVHTIALDPLPENVMWWIAVERPDGAKVVGSTTPLDQ